MNKTVEAMRVGWLVIYKTPTFQLAGESKCFLNAGWSWIHSIYPALSPTSCDLGSISWLTFIPAPLYTWPTQTCFIFSFVFCRTLTDMYDWVRFGRIALQYPQGKADQQQLHLGILVRRLIQALLGCPVLSKWSTQKKKERKIIKTQSQTEPRSSSW